MGRRWVLAAGALWAVTAHAGVDPDFLSRDTRPQAAEAQRRLTQIDLHLRAARDATAATWSAAQRRGGTAVEQEDAALAAQSLRFAERHAALLGRMRGDVIGRGAVTELRGAIRHAERAAGRLRGAARSDDPGLTSSLAAQLAGLLRDCEDRFGSIAEQQRLTRLERIVVPERQPVRGVDPASRTPSQTFTPRSSRPFNDKPVDSSLHERPAPEEPPAENE